MDVPAGGVTQEGGYKTFLHLPPAVLALIFLARRIQSFLALVDREVDFLCINTGFYGDKILYKNLKIFDKIFVPTFCC